jgi:hypothetical protein
LLNLPLKSQYLLTGEKDLDDASESSEASSLERIGYCRREVDIFISAPFVGQAQKSIKTISSKLAEALNVLNSRHTSHLINNTTNSAALNDSIFNKLRMHCANPLNNLDINIVDLNFADLNLGTDSHQYSSDQLPLIDNKYFRRSLSRLILTDLLSIDSNTNSKSLLTPYSIVVVIEKSSSLLTKKKNRIKIIIWLMFYAFFFFFLLQILLSDIQFEEEDESNLLCPIEIESTDCERFIINCMNKQELELFNRYYKKSSTTSNYRLHVDYFSLNNSNTSELDALFALLKRKFELDESSSSSVTGDSLTNRLKLKYLKSIQQEEIELIVNNAKDSSLIIWLHLASLSNTNEKNIGNNFNLNQLRYKSVLNLLQSKVLGENYKRITLMNSTSEESRSSSTVSTSSSHHNIHHQHYHHHSGGSASTHFTKSQNQHIEKEMNDFLFKLISNQLDTYINQLNKNNINNFILSESLSLLLLLLFLLII